VPRAGSGWGACNAANPKNRRRRCSLLVERQGADGITRVLIDTSPDLREQLIDAGITHLDAVVISHDHADHTHGIDDLRPLVLHQRRVADIYADAVTSRTLSDRFGYIFHAPEGSPYPPIARLHGLTDGVTLHVDGPGGAISLLPIEVEHGPGYKALGFRIGRFAYVSDVSLIPPAAMNGLRGLDLLVLDALRWTPHPTHFSVSDALAAIAALQPKRAVLTNLHTDLDHQALEEKLPDGVAAAFDGMSLDISM
jgi:phosphoribosyl 1,2-cyclic phosphate phosphodiesterase